MTQESRTHRDLHIARSQKDLYCRQHGLNPDTFPDPIRFQGEEDPSSVSVVTFVSSEDRHPIVSFYIYPNGIPVQVLPDERIGIG